MTIAPWLIWSAIGAFTVLGIVLSVLATRASRKTASDFFLAGRTTGSIVAGLSYAATTYSAYMLVVLTGLTYRGGIGALGFELIYFAGLSLLVVFAPRYWLAAKRWGFVSPSEMFGARFADRRVARLMAAISIVFLLPYCTTQMAGIGLLLSGVTDSSFDLFQAVLIGAILAIGWTLFAGLRSVAWTDSVQALLMIGSAIVALGFALVGLGGFSGFINLTVDNNPEWLEMPGPGLWQPSTFVALALPWFFFAISNPQVAQRLFIVKDFKAMRNMILWVLGFGLLFTQVAIWWGFASLQVAPDLANTATASPALMTSGLIPVPVVLLLVLGILAAAISTLDSIALTMGSLIARDFGPRLAFNDRAQIFTGRVVVVAVIVIASYFALQSVEIVDQLAALSAAGLMVMVPTIIGAFFWKRSTHWGALWSMAGGALSAIYLALIEGINVFNPLLVGAVALVSVGLFVGVSLLTQPQPAALDFSSELASELAKHRAW
jgi:SSS family solute:Na+ symporter